MIENVKETLMQSSVNLFLQVYPELKFWSTIGCVFFAIFKGINWLKDIKTKDLKEIQDGVGKMQSSVDAGFSNLKTEVESQTNSIVKELQELRADFRVYMPAMRARAARRKK